MNINRNLLTVMLTFLALLNPALLSAQSASDSNTMGGQPTETALSILNTLSEGNPVAEATLSLATLALNKNFESAVADNIGEPIASVFNKIDGFFEGKVRSIHYAPGCGPQGCAPGCDRRPTPQYCSEAIPPAGGDFGTYPPGCGPFGCAPGCFLTSYFERSPHCSQATPPDQAHRIPLGTPAPTETAEQQNAHWTSTVIAQKMNELRKNAKALQQTSHQVNIAIAEEATQDGLLTDNFLAEEIIEDARGKIKSITHTANKILTHNINTAWNQLSKIPGLLETALDNGATAIGQEMQKACLAATPKGRLDLRIECAKYTGKL